MGPVLLQNEEDDQSTTSCKYYTVIQSSSDDISFLHLNKASLKLHYNELENFLSNCKIKFDFIGICEIGFKNQEHFQLSGFQSEDCLTESPKGGVRIYISDNFIILSEKILLSIKKK